MPRLAMPFVRILAVVCALPGLPLTAGEGVGAIVPLPGPGPGPGAQPRPMLPGGAMMRSAPTCEVEALLVAPADPAAMAAWATLAATGYRVVATVPAADGVAIPYLERVSTGQHLPLPAVVEREASVAAAVGTRILAERQAQQAARSAPPAGPQPAAPAVAPAPVAPAALNR